MCALYVHVASRVCVFLQENISDYIFKCNSLVYSNPPKTPSLHHSNMTTDTKKILCAYNNYNIIMHDCVHVVCMLYIVIVVRYYRLRYNN